jgi:hypothetical protein
MGSLPYGIAAGAVLTSETEDSNLLLSATKGAQAMTPLEFLIITAVILSLAVLRFGIPILVMWLGRFVYCRVLHLNL